jgi:hypothetical protein
VGEFFGQDCRIGGFTGWWRGRKVVLGGRGF